jgi:hypothetical protein
MHTDAIARTSDPVCALRPGVNGGSFEGEWRFHDEMEPAVRSDQEREVLAFRVRASVGCIPTGSGNIEYTLGVLKQRIHVQETYRLEERLFEPETNS